MKLVHSGEESKSQSHEQNSCLSSYRETRTLRLQLWQPWPMHPWVAQGEMVRLKEA